MTSEVTLAKIARLLRDEAPEKQMAAAIVLSELRCRDRTVIQGLLALLDSPLPALQRHALNALAAAGTTKAIPHAVALVSARDEALRQAAADALARFGEAALPAVRERLAKAPPVEKRVLEEVLGRLGGQEALSTLLSGLDPEDLEAARNATLPLRARLKEADARERRRTLEQVKAFLGNKRAGDAPAARMAALKILGYLREPAARPLLLGYALDARQAEAVRSEAIVALRFAPAPTGRATKTTISPASKTLDPALAEKLLRVAETAPLEVARTALYSFVGASLPPSLGRRLARLASHAETARARLAIELVGQIEGRPAADTLGRLLLETPERVRAEAAAEALARRDDAGPALARALLEAPDRDRAQMVASLLRPRLRTLDGALVGRLADTATSMLEKGDPRADPLLETARAADRRLTAERLRSLGDRLRKARKTDRALQVLRVLGRSAEASPEDGYALASLELGAGHREEALIIMSQLSERGFDVAGALRKDRTLDHQHRYLVGFHFAERGHPLGEELLITVAAAAGRTKVGQMARAKLKSSGLAT